MSRLRSYCNGLPVASRVIVWILITLQNFVGKFNRVSSLFEFLLVFSVYNNIIMFK